MRDLTSRWCGVATLFLVACSSSGEPSDTQAVDSGVTADTGLPPLDAGSDLGPDGEADAGSEVSTDAVTPSGPRVFVTSDEFDGAFADGVRDSTGRAQAFTVGDGLCQKLADAAGLGGTWSVWLSSAQGDAIDHVKGAGPWKSLAGKVVFADRAGLAAAALAPIDRDEKGLSVPSGSVVWTGTALGGRRFADPKSGTTDCYGWGYRGTDATTGGVVGSTAVSAEWTRQAMVNCNTKARLYCFEG